jgi:hypothetical protein
MQYDVTLFSLLTYFIDQSPRSSPTGHSRAEHHSLVRSHPPMQTSNMEQYWPAGSYDCFLFSPASGSLGTVVVGAVHAPRKGIWVDFRDWVEGGHSL